VTDCKFKFRVEHSGHGSSEFYSGWLPVKSDGSIGQFKVVDTYQFGKHNTGKIYLNGDQIASY
jgi:hypothetical protein